MRYLTFLAALAVASSSYAQPSDEPVRAEEIRGSQRPPPVLTEAERALGFAVAQVCANEASLRQARPADCALIYQATRRHGDTPEEQLRWLQRHSRCVLGPSAPAPDAEVGNCHWTRQLTREGTQPAAWTNTASWETHRPRWLRMLAFCDRMAAGQRPRGGWPCRRNPDTWGGSMDPAVGYEPVICRGTANRGWRYPHWDRSRRPTRSTPEVVVLPPPEA